MKLARTLALVPVAAALLAFGSTAQAQWSTSFSDMGVQYTLTDLGGTSTNRSFSLLLNTTGYNHADQTLAFLDSVDIKAWTGENISFSLASAPGGVSAWTEAISPISSGPATNTGCSGSGGGFACVETNTKGIFSVLTGSSYAFEFDVTLNSGSFLTSSVGAHIGAGYADEFGEGRSYGITSYSVTPVPEPETYAMLLAGLGLLGFAARRRKLKEASSA